MRRALLLLLVYSVDSLVVPALSQKKGQARLKSRRPNVVSTSRYDGTTKKKPKKIEFWHSVALVAGSTVGGGVVALPTVSYGAGFQWSVVEIVFFWGINALTGIVLAEAACTEMALTGKPATIRDIFESRLGHTAGLVSAGLLVASNCFLLIGYCSQGGTALGELFHMQDTEVFTMIFGIGACFSIARLSSKTIDALNSISVAIMTLSFFLAIAMWLPHCHFSFSTAEMPPVELSTLTKMAPIIGSALTFQSCAPVVAERLRGDTSASSRAIILGSLLPAIAYVAFDFSVLTRIPLSDLTDFRIDGLLDPLQALPYETQFYSGIALSTFSFCAIATSFLGTGLSQIHELQGLPQLKTRPALLHALALAPAASVLLLPPDIFLTALTATGLFANPILFWLFPAGLLLQASVSKQQPFDWQNHKYTDDTFETGTAMPQLAAIHIISLYTNARSSLSRTPPGHTAITTTRPRRTKKDR